MRTALLSLLFAACATWLAFAGPCSGAEAQLAQGSKALALNTPDSAENALRAVSVSNPDCPELMLQQARLAQAKGSFNEAADLFYRYTDIDPNDSRGLAYFGRFFLEQRDYVRADALSAAAVDKNPDDPVALALRGQILVMKGESSAAQSLLDKAIQIDLNDADHAYQKGLQVNQPGRFHDAFLDYNYGRFLAKRNDLSGSKRHLDRAVESTPEIRAVWYERARVDLRMQNYEQARSDAERAAACTQTGGIIDLQLYSLLTQVYTRLGNTELAKKYADLTRDTPAPVRGEQR